MVHPQHPSPRIADLDIEKFGERPLTENL